MRPSLSLSLASAAGRDMSTSSRRRLVRDFKKMNSDPPPGINAAPLHENIMVWQAVIFGPDETPWEGGTFNLLLEFSEDYPNKPPKVRFVSRIFHPNVYADGQICLDILQAQWSPIYDVSAVLKSIQSLLSDPNPKSPANSEAAKLFVRKARTQSLTPHLTPACSRFSHALTSPAPPSPLAERKQGRVRQAGAHLRGGVVGIARAPPLSASVFGFSTLFVLFSVESCCVVLEKDFIFFPGANCPGWTRGTWRCRCPVSPRSAPRGPLPRPSPLPPSYPRTFSSQSCTGCSGALSCAPRGLSA